MTTNQIVIYAILFTISYLCVISLTYQIWERYGRALGVATFIGGMATVTATVWLCLS